MLGPVLLSLYMCGLSDIIRRHHIQFHHYADDMQLYIAQVDKSNIHLAYKMMENCIADVRIWLITMKLKLNCNKTAFIVLHSNMFAI